MTTADDPSFIDTNILIYAALPSSPFYSRAFRALDDLEQAGVELWISRQILREYIAAQTRGVPFIQTIPLPDLVNDVKGFQDRYRIAEDGPLVTEQLLTLIGLVPVGGKQVHDANIVATMLAHGLRRLLTHNTGDFRRFSQWIDVIPLVPSP